MNPMLVVDVIRFELARSLTAARIAIWVVLVAFPISLIAAIRFLSTVPLDRAVEQVGMTMYYLVPEVACLLGLLLWATPAIATEIEGQTWIYLATRRSGRTAVVIGKYLTAVIWSFSAALVSVTFCVLIVGSAGSMSMWLVMCGLAFLSCIAHAAIFILLGSIFHRRAMVTAVFYTLAIEYGLSFVPALANKLTINYRLRGLLADWTDWELARSQVELISGSEPASTHLAVLALSTLGLLAATLLRVSRAEYPTQQDG